MESHANWKNLRTFSFTERSNHRRCSVKKVVLKYFANFTGKHLCWCLFLIKFQACRTAPLLKMRLQHRCFPLKFAKFFRTPILKNICKGLLLITDFYNPDFAFKKYAFLNITFVNTFIQFVCICKAIIKILDFCDNSEHALKNIPNTWLPKCNYFNLFAPNVSFEITSRFDIKRSKNINEFLLTFPLINPMYIRYLIEI